MGSLAVQSGWKNRPTCAVRPAALDSAILTRREPLMFFTSPPDEPVWNRFDLPDEMAFKALIDDFLPKK